MHQDLLLKSARKYFADRVSPIFSKEPELANPVENYNYLLEFSDSSKSVSSAGIIRKALSQKNISSMDIFAYVPQCAYHCKYCPFPVTLDSRSEEDAIRLIKEASVFRSNFDISNIPVANLCIGGGTPTLLSAESIFNLVSNYRTQFKISSDSQITLECSPDSLTYEKVVSAKQAGVNRVSMGIQTFDENELKKCGRKHSSLRAKNSSALLMGGGFRDVNLDLIRGFPGQTLENFLEDINCALETKADSFHVYRMRLPNNHVLLKKSDNLEKYLEKVIAMQFVADNLLQDRGYSRHHTSHWTKKQDATNLSTGNWKKDRSVFGFGWSAYSYLPSGECRNSCKLSSWRKLADSGVPTLEKGYKYTSDEIELRWIKFVMKTLNISSSQFALRFNKPISESLAWSKLTRLVNAGVLKFEQDGDVLAFTYPGFLIAEEAIRFVSSK